MMKHPALRPLTSLALILVVLLTAISLAGANGTITETEYSTSLAEATGIVRIIVAIAGGVVAVLGIVVALRNIGGTAGVEISVSEQKKLAFKNISQGVVIVLIGAAMLVAAVYLLPEKQRERHITGKEITVDPKGRMEVGE